jgi:hypothetical protein
MSESYYESSGRKDSSEMENHTPHLQHKKKSSAFIEYKSPHSGSNKILLKHVNNERLDINVSPL